MDDLPTSEGGTPFVEKEEERPQSRPEIPTGEKEAVAPPPEAREKQPPEEPAKEPPDLAKEAEAEGAQMAGQLTRPTRGEVAPSPQVPVQQPRVEERPAVSQFTHTAIRKKFAREVARARLRQLEARGGG